MKKSKLVRVTLDRIHKDVRCLDRKVARKFTALAGQVTELKGDVLELKDLTARKKLVRKAAADLKQLVDATPPAKVLLKVIMAKPTLVIALLSLIGLRLEGC